MFGYKPLSATGDVTGDDVALNTPIDVADDIDGLEVVEAMLWVVDVGEEFKYTVAVLSVIVVLTLEGGAGGGAGEGEGGGTFGGGGGSCPLRTASNGGGTTLTIAHFSVNQFEVSWRSAGVQIRAKQ